MYVQDATFKVPTKKQVRKTIAKKLQYMADNGRISKSDFLRLSAPDCYEMSALVQDVRGLCEAITKKRDVFLVCDKEPRNLDSGRHWYSLFFVSKQGKRVKFWPGSDSILAKVVGMDENNRDRNMPKWGFSSSVIGMDRALDATDGLSYFLGECKAGYVQFTGWDIL